MPLLQFWKTAKDEGLKMTIEQVVPIAGDGVLHDHSPCSAEFRQFLSVAPIERLFEYHPKWDEFLAEGKDGYFIISCMDRDEAFAMSNSWVAENKQNLNMTERGERSYWHVPVTTLEGGGLAMNASWVGTKTRLKPFRFDFKQVSKVR